MLSNARLRAALLLARRAQISSRRTYAYSANDRQEINDPNPRKNVPNVSKSNELPMKTPERDAPVQEYVEDAEKLRVMQEPNRAGVWSRSQNPRADAMTGPRFEQTLMEFQVSTMLYPMRSRNSESLIRRNIEFHQGQLLQKRRANMPQQPVPLAAIEFIHKQPVRWSHKRVVECDGGGGPLGHPRIFINVDKPEICSCTYCGLPYVSIEAILIAN